MYSMRRILRLSWSDVIHNKVRTYNVRLIYNNIKAVNIQIANRRLIFIGRADKIDQNKVLGTLLSVWIRGKDLLEDPINL